MAVMQRRKTIEGSCQTSLNVDTMDNRLDTGIQNYRFMQCGHCFVRQLSSQNGALDGFKRCVLGVSSNLKLYLHTGMAKLKRM